MFILLYIMMTPGDSEAAKNRRCHLKILGSIKNNEGTQRGKAFIR
jgi:hypothetical protein